MRHTVTILRADSDPLVLSSSSLCPFIPLQDIHKANILTLYIYIPLTMGYGVPYLCVLSTLLTVRSLYPELLCWRSSHLPWVGSDSYFSMVLKSAQNYPNDMCFWHFSCFFGMEWQLQGKWSGSANSKLFNGCLTFQVYRVCYSQLLIFSFKF